ncbi:MAG TPA: Dna2/Cas4 domain-containing protein, partial [Bacteroidales bacterium]|nr:Dna2/Cas4 domain-containing protein [Bacteroidales bacterium]
VKVRTEQELVKDGRGILRPDRVVYLDNGVEIVDYKFGLKTEDSHKRQVREYMDALAEIETCSIKGFVWYVTTGKIEEIS